VKLRCAILDDYQRVALKLADWSVLAADVDIKVYHQHFSDEQSLITALKSCDILVVMRERSFLSATILVQLKRLKLIVTSGMRNAAIDIKFARAQGIEVCGTTSLTQPPVELTWALILGLARNIVSENQAFKSNGPWQSTVGISLHNKQLGILGLGKIGQRVAQIGKAFGMKVMAWSQNLTQEQAESVDVCLADSKQALLTSSDFVSIHLILSERTRHLIGASELKSMRSSAYLINTSRAQIIQQDDLLQALEQGWIAGAGLDVFDMEPLPAGDRLRTLPNVLATPHLGYVTEANYQLYFSQAVENIQAFLAGQPIRLI